mmetsp:Transcript_79811/g.180048  ORF Transcript_79811/g.180048 Transcript_79811/m.180048 type:complete len:108 (+) Transcript_79811:1-324(+)
MNMRHPYMDAVELTVSRQTGPTYKAYSCHDPQATEEASHQSTPPLDTKQKFYGLVDPLGHQISGYEDELRFFHRIGYGHDFGIDPLTATTARYKGIMFPQWTMWSKP